MAGAQEVRAFEVTCPPGIAKATPQITNLVMPVRTVISIRVRVPPGCLSSMGFAIGAAGVAIIPYQSSVFVVADDETFEWAIPGQIDSGAWQVQMYNTGQYPHTIYMYWTVMLPDTPRPNPLTQGLPLAALNSPLYVPPVPAGATVTPASIVVPAPPPLARVQ